MMTLIGMLFGAGLWLAIQSFTLPTRIQKVIPKRNIWPVFIDEVATGIQVGMSLPEAFFGARTTLPPRQQVVLERSYYEMQHGSAFKEILKALEKDIRSQDFSRLVTLLAMSSNQGIHQLSSLLQDFSSAIRRDNDLTLEIATKYQTNKIAARVASVAPLFVLLFTATRTEVRTLYLTSEGMLVLLVIAIISLGGYFAMTRIASLPGIGQ